MTLEWEDVDQKPELSGYMRRASVPGGWIYHCVDSAPMYDHQGSLQGGFAWRSSMCFVPTHQPLE
jgi:hypothetical protein